MCTDWKEVTIGEITTSCLGKMLDKQKNKGEYQPYLANVNVRWGGFDLSDLPTMRFEESEQERYGLRYGDIVLCEGGEPGRCAIWKNQLPNMKIQKALHRIRTCDGVSNEFLYYWFLWAGKRGMLNSYFTGTTIQHLPGEKLKSIRLRLPPLDYQKNVAAILSCLDNKIELNKQINENLQQQAQAVFKNEIKGSTAEVPFTQFIKVLGGGTPKTGRAEYWGGEIPFFTPKDVGTPYVLETLKTITERGLNNCNSQLYPTNTTFVTARGTVGKVSLAGVPMAMNQSCYALASETLNPMLVYMYTLEAVESLKHKASGAVFDAITTVDISSEKIKILSAEKQDTLNRLLEIIYNDIEGLIRQNMVLRSLRDKLLAKLIVI